MEGHVADCCQCSFGAKAYGKDGEVLGPCKKRTKLMTTREEMARRLTRSCECTEEHVAVRGKRAKRLQNYPEEMVREIAGVMAMSGDEIADACCCHEDFRLPKCMVEEMAVCMVEAVMAEDDQQDEAMKEHLKDMRKKFGAETVRTVLKLHRMLGHPPTAALAAHLRHAGAEAEWIQCAKELKCQHCKERERPRAVRVARIPRASHFNELVEMDTFYVMHKEEMRKVLTIQDVYSRFTVDVPVKKETAGCELRALEQHWCSWAGAPKELRIDSSGAHMSEKFKKGCEVNNIKLRIIPHGSHRQLGALERDHQVRREQLALYARAFPDDSLRRALRETAQQRNRMRSVGGSSPAMLALGYVPRIPGCHDEFNLAEQARHQDVQSQAHEDLMRRTAAAKAYLEANASRSVRMCLLARSRPERREYAVGEMVYYWRKDPATSVAVKAHWRGPAVVCSVEPRVEGHDAEPTETTWKSVYWLAHGSSLVRCAAELMRPETPEEADERKEREGQIDDGNAGEDDTGLEKVLKQLRTGNAQGPIRYHDVTGEEHLKSYKADMDALLPQAEEETYEDWENLQREVKRMRRDAPRSRDGEGPSEAEIRELKKQDYEEPGESNTSASVSGSKVRTSWRPEKPMQMTPKEAFPMVMSPERRERAYQMIVDASKESADKLDGVPAKRRKIQEEKLEDVLRPGEEEDETMEMELLMAEEDEVYMASKTGTLIYSKLTPEEKEQFEVAKTEALMPWIEHDGIQGADEKEAENGEVCPLKYLLKWKVKEGKKKANARLIFRGFKHKDVVNDVLDKESPTLSRLSKHIILMTAVVKKWAVFAADVKSAFLQSEDLRKEGIRLFGRPTSEMEKRLVEMGVMKRGQILRMTKPAFGDVRAPKLWNKKIDGVMKTDHWRSRKLDNCLYMSYRDATKDDEEAEKTWDEVSGRWKVLDGLVGLHVDDLLGCGEGIWSKEKMAKEKYHEEEASFRARVKRLSEKFKFGSWDFLTEEQDLTFCGGEIKLLDEGQEIQLRHETYLHKVKPITIQKERKQQPGEKLTPKEIHQLRAGIGALAWPGNQSCPHLSCSISLLQSAVADAKIEDLQSYNKLLAFAKANADVGLRFRCPRGSGRIGDLRLGVYFDAAWAVRPCGSSQGGYVLFATSQDMIDEGKPGALVIVDYGSKKLARKARSSLAAEVQAGSLATDQLEWTKVFMSLDPGWRAEKEETASWFGSSPVITDAKSLYDASRSASAGLGLSEKRTAIELDAMMDRMKVFDGQLRWTSAFQQVADGMTKPRARQAMAEVLRRGTHAMKYAEECVAGKKLTREDKERIEKELEEGREGSAKGEKQNKKRPSSWKSWGAPAIMKSILMAEAIGVTKAEDENENETVTNMQMILEVSLAMFLIVATTKMIIGAWMKETVKKEEGSDVSRNTEDASVQTDDVGSAVLHDVPKVYLTRHGEVVHLTPSCRHLRRSTGVQQFLACRHCMSGG